MCEILQNLKKPEAHTPKASLCEKVYHTYKKVQNTWSTIRCRDSSKKTPELHGTLIFQTHPGPPQQVRLSSFLGTFSPRPPLPSLNRLWLCFLLSPSLRPVTLVQGRGRRVFILQEVHCLLFFPLPFSIQGGGATQHGLERLSARETPMPPLPLLPVPTLMALLPV